MTVAGLKLILVVGDNVPFWPLSRLKVVRLFRPTGLLRGCGVTRASLLILGPRFTPT